MNLNQWFDIGISKEKYMDALDKRRESFFQIYNQFSVPEEDIQALKQHRNVRAVVLAEVWCGHCMLDIAIFLHLAKEANIPISFLPRDEHLELMDQYLTNDKRIIPIIIFIDEDGNELAKWGPMAPEINSFVDELKKNLPDKNDPSYDEAFQHFIKEVVDAFTTDTTLWQHVYTDIKRTLLSI